MIERCMAVACAMTLGLVASGAAADVLNFTAIIDEAQADACAGTGSPGTGMGTFTLDTSTGEVVYFITFSGLVGVETMAHVHGAAPTCINAGIVYALPTGSPKMGTATLTPGQMQDMMDGLHYVNIHTDRDPGGEIRGQILPVDPTYAFGLPHSPLGQAMLSLDPSGVLIVSNIGSSGEDGVQTDYGLVRGFSAAYDIGPAGAISPGTSMSIEPVASSVPVLRSSDAQGGHPQEVLDLVAAATGDLFVSLTTDDIGLYVTRAVLLQQGRIVLDSDYSSVPPNPVVMGPIGSSGADPFEVSVAPTADGVFTVYRIKVPAAGSFTINGLSAAMADEVQLFLPDGVPVRAKVSVKMQNTSGDMVLKGKKILQNFHEHAASGEATMTGVPDVDADGWPDLEVGNIGSSGQDGVVVGPYRPGGVSADAAGVGAEFMPPIDITTAGHMLDAAATGAVAGAVPGTMATMTAGLSGTGGSAVLSADFSALGAADVRVIVLNDGAMVSEDVVPAGSVATISAIPPGDPGLARLGATTSTMPFSVGNDPPAIRITLDGDASITPTGFIPEIGDEVLCVAESPLQTLATIEHLELNAANIGPFTLVDAPTRWHRDFNGLPIDSSGDPTFLDVDSDDDGLHDEIEVAPIGSSGEDGVDAGLGAGQGWGAEFAIADAIGTLPAGSGWTVTVRPVNDAPTLSVPFMAIGSGLAEGMLHVNGAPPTSGEVTVRAFTTGEGEVAYQQVYNAASGLPDPLFTLPMVSMGGREPAIVFQFNPQTLMRTTGVFSGNVIVRFRLADSTADAAVAGVNIGPIGALEVIYADDFSGVLDPDYLGGEVRGMASMPQTREHILLSRQVGMLFGHEHAATGGARYIMQRNESDLSFLRVLSGDGAGGSLSIAPRRYGDPAQVHLECRRVNVQATSIMEGGNNEHWHMRAHASMPIVAGNDVISGVNLLASRGQRDVEAEPIPWMAPEAIETRVFSGGVLVASMGGLSPGIVATSIVPDTPGTYEFELVVSDVTGLADEVRHRFVWDTPRDIIVPGLTPVLADEIMVILRPAPGRVRSMGVPMFDIDHIDFGITPVSSEVSVDITDETATWVNTCPADIDNDASVSVTDLLALLAAWGSCPAPCPPDIDGDGSVTVTDLLALLAAWGPCP